MEAVPRLHMLSFPRRTSTKPTDLGEHLKRYIRDNYGEDPESYNNEVQELEDLRRSAVNPSLDFNGCSALKKYYCQLYFLSSRFPFDEGRIPVSFHWNSAFDQSHVESGDIKLEKKSILYNIAALHTHLGESLPRTTPDGMKTSYTHFQWASWAFETLSQTSESEGEFNTVLITFMMNLCLSQAQECILEKSMTDSRKPNIIAKLAMQVVEYLRLTMKNLENFKKSNSKALELVGSKLTKAWQRCCDFKVAYYLAVTLFYQGLQAEEQQKMGERISFFQGAVDKLDEALKLSKNVDKAKGVLSFGEESDSCEEDCLKQIGETLTFANDVIRGKLTAAQKENEFVYHEKVPPLNSLPEVKGATLVKEISFSLTDKQIAGNDIFGRLVPMEAHQASSLYSEEKAKLLRRMTSEIQEKNDVLKSYLASMQLDSFAFEENFDDLPQELIDSCADLNSRDAFQTLKDIMDRINKVYFDLQSKIKETEALIKEEENKEKEFCVMTGTKKVPNHMISELKREVSKYKEAHEAAQTSNQALHSAITQHRENISILSEPLNSLIESLPSVAGVESEADKATRMEVQRLINKVREMQVQRTELENKLRTGLLEDDVTKQLVTNQSDEKEFFKEQLSKHDLTVSLLEKNMSAQHNILTALSEANAAYGAMRRTINQVKGQRSEIINSLLASYNAFLNITEKAEEAKEFYAKLESQINKVHSRTKSFCKVQEEEREEKLLANVKKFGGSVQLDASHDSKLSGPKLKDFLQAGMGLKSGHSEISPVVDISSSQKDYGLRNAASIGSTQLNQGYISTPARPSPVGSERNDRNHLPGVIQHPYSSSSQFPPSAPSPAPGPPYNNSSIPYPSTTSYQLSNKSSSLPYSTDTQNTSGVYPYSAYVPPSCSMSQVGYNLAKTSSSATTITATSNQNISGVSTQSYPPQSQLLPQTTKPANSVQYYQYGTNTQPSNFYAGQYPPNQTPQSNISQSYKGQPASQYQPPISYSSNFTSGNRSNSSNSNLSTSYVSQAGTPNTNLTSSGKGQNYPQPSDMKYQPYSTAGVQYPQTNYQAGAPSNFSIDNTSVGGATNPLPNYPSNTVQSSYPSQGSSGFNVTPHTTNQGFVNSNNSIGSYQVRGTNNSYAGYIGGQTVGPSMRGQTPYSNTANVSIGTPSVTLTQSQSAYNKNIPSFANVSTVNPTNNLSKGVAPPYNQGYSHNLQASSNGSRYEVPGNQYQTPMPTYSVPYNNIPSSIAPISYAYNAAANTPQSSGSNYQQQTQQYQAPQAGISQGNYSNQQGINQTDSNQGGPPTPKETAQIKPAPNQGGISNLDLLSGIDMNTSASNQWSPLIPQTTVSSNSGSVVTATTSSIDSLSSLTISGTEKDIENSDVKSSISNLNGDSTDVSTQAKADAFSQGIDLSKFPKPKRSGSMLDPLSSDDALNLLASETERFSKFVQGLDKKSLNGPTNLELKWSELTETLEAKCSSLKVSVGRCYPLKNRFPDNLSFDATRVPLPSTRDDYINASYVQLKSVEDSIPLIITQAPIPNTFSEFWLMVWENQVEMVVCLNTDAEVKSQTYIPKDASVVFESGNFTISLKQIRPSPNEAWIQRTLHLTNNTLKTTKVVLHLQFLNWPPSAMPDSPALFLQFISEVHNVQKQQRNKLKPVVVHCVSGTGRSGVFAVLSSFMKHLHSRGSLADVWNLIIELSQQRRSALQDRAHLLFLYSSALYYAQELLMKRGILTDKATFEDGPREKTHVRHPSADLLSSDLNKMKAKLGLDETQASDSNNLSRSGSQLSLVSGGSSAGMPPELSISRPSSVSPSPTHSAGKGGKLGPVELPPNLAASLDPNCLVLNNPKPNKLKKITKENFLNPSGLSTLGQIQQQQQQQESDPFSGLDPLWNLKKN